MKAEQAPGSRVWDGLFLPVLFSSLSMFLASWVWHGTVLNDLSDLGDRQAHYLLFSAFGYLCLALVISLLGRYVLEQVLTSKIDPPMWRVTVVGLLVGVLMGVAVHGMALPVKGRFEVMHLSVDLLWQVAEQGLGGYFAGLGLFLHSIRTRLEQEGAL